MSVFSRNGKSEPSVSPLPQPPKPSTQAAQAWLDEHEMFRQDNAYLRDELTRVSNGLKLANEHIAMLKQELAHVSDARDRLSWKYGQVLNSFDNIMMIMVAEKKKSKAQEYAPAGTGVDPDAERTAEAQEKIDEAAAELGKMLAPEIKADA